VLLVDDERTVADVFSTALEAQGFTVALAHGGKETLKVFQELAPDVVVLDVVLPDMSGIAVCETIRKRSSVPIVMISGRATETDVIAALEAGADDYLIKPFGTAVLVARIRAALRRSSPADAPDALLQVGILTVSPGRGQAWLRGQALDLPDKEFALLEALVRHPGRIITRASIMRDVWGSEGSVSKKALDATMRRLRQKLGDRGGSIVTVRGVGFRLEPDRLVP
jgi:DNA-binding response OmpR family regulator